MLADEIRMQRLHECGNDIEKALDPNVAWMVDDEHVCQACATRDMVMRRHEKEHEKDPDIPGRPKWSDGRIISVRPATGRDLRDAKAGKQRQMSRG